MVNPPRSLSRRMSAANARPIYVAILGADALLASRPHDPVQLTRACQSVGFDLVVPVSWGEEVIATQIADRLTSKAGSSFVAAVCPLVDERVSETPSQTPALRTVPPAIATARYLRAALQHRHVHVTYVGACRGASDPEIDVHCLPQTLFTRLVDAGIDIARQPRHLDAQLPVDRARYASTPGGVPDGNWLMSQAGVRVIEAAPITADVVAMLYRDEPLLIDLAASCKCVCARDRVALARTEPPRSTKPVVTEVRVCVMKEPMDESEPVVEPSATPIAMPETRVADRRARFAEFGLEGDATPPPPPNPGTLSRTVEPW
jgi:hypothetical protein